MAGGHFSKSTNFGYNPEAEELEEGYATERSSRRASTIYLIRPSLAGTRQPSFTSRKSQRSRSASVASSNGHNPLKLSRQPSSGSSSTFCTSKEHELNKLFKEATAYWASLPQSSHDLWQAVPMGLSQLSKGPESPQQPLTAVKGSLNISDTSRPKEEKPRLLAAQSGTKGYEALDSRGSDRGAARGNDLPKRKTKMPKAFKFRRLPRNSSQQRRLDKLAS